LDGADDFIIAGTAAEISGELEADVVFGGLWVFVEESLGGHEEAGSADAALQGGTFKEALLERVQMTVLGEAFDGFDFRAFGFRRENDAAIHGDAIHDDGAGSAITVVAALFGAGQTQRVAERFEKTLPRLAEEFGWLAVNGGGDVEFFGHGRKG
jgi:hypothetical protein